MAPAAGTAVNVKDEERPAALVPLGNAVTLTKKYVPAERLPESPLKKLLPTCCHEDPFQFTNSAKEPWLVLES